MQQSLASGARLAHYRIAERIGAGGMGEVYKAVDERLDRTVALKILPPELVSHSDRVRRFVQEAKAASSLNHPHIVTIHEIGEGVPTHDGDAVASDGPLHYIAMEFVDGETLKRRIYAEKRRLKENLRILSEAAEGLAKAHASGIVHRDLKPDNIMVSRDGYAKVVDFGLAKLTDVSLDGNESSRTALREKTREGVILGTVGYMSPEQVEGKQTDHRSDIFSFGCILYETITQRRPFASDTDVDTLHAILHNDPPSISDVAPSVPPELRRMVRRCLAKDPEKRYQSMKDLAIELRDLVEEFDQLTPGSGSTSAPALTPMRRRGSPLRAVVISAVVIAAVAAALAFWKRSEPTTPRVTASPAAMKLTPLTSNGKIVSATISPDGRYLVYVRADRGEQKVFLKQTATGSEVQILPASTTASFGSFTFSLDGNYIYMVSRERGRSSGSLYLIPTLGGSPRQLISGVDSRVSLSPDGRELVFRRDEPGTGQQHLMIASADGSNQRRIASQKDPDFYSASPAWSPDGKWIASGVALAKGGMHANVVIVSRDGKELRQLLQRWWFGVYSLAWLSDGSGIVVVGQEVEAPRNQVWLFSFPAGEPRRITNDLNSYASVSVTGDGKSLVTVQSETTTELWKEKKSEKTRITVEGERDMPIAFWPAADGSLYYQSMSSGNLDIWKLLPSGERRQLTSDGKADYAPLPTPDGSRIVFLTERSGDAEFWSMNNEGGDQKRLARVGFDAGYDISPDGRWIVYGNQVEFWRIPISGGTPVKIGAHRLTTPPRHSPDGQWLAGFIQTAPPPTPAELAVIPVSGGAAKKVADVPSTAVRLTPRWIDGGKAVTYVNRVDGVDNLWMQPVDGSPAKQLTKYDSGEIRHWEFMPDGTMYVVRSTWRADAIMISDFH